MSAKMDVTDERTMESVPLIPAQHPSCKDVGHTLCHLLVDLRGELQIQVPSSHAEVSAALQAAHATAQEQTDLSARHSSTSQG